MALVYQKSIGSGAGYPIKLSSGGIMQEIKHNSKRILVSHPVQDDFSNPNFNIYGADEFDNFSEYSIPKRGEGGPPPFFEAAVQKIITADKDYYAICNTDTLFPYSSPLMTSKDNMKTWKSIPFSQDIILALQDSPNRYKLYGEFPRNLSFVYHTDGKVYWYNATFGLFYIDPMEDIVKMTGLNIIYNNEQALVAIGTTPSLISYKGNLYASSHARYNYPVNKYNDIYVLKEGGNNLTSWEICSRPNFNNWEGVYDMIYHAPSDRILAAVQSSAYGAKLLTFNSDIFNFNVNIGDILSYQYLQFIKSSTSEDYFLGSQNDFSASINRIIYYSDVIYDIETFRHPSGYYGTGSIAYNPYTNAFYLLNGYGLGKLDIPSKEIEMLVNYSYTGLPGNTNDIRVQYYQWQFYASNNVFYIVGMGRIWEVTPDNKFILKYHKQDYYSGDRVELNPILIDNSLSITEETTSEFIDISIAWRWVYNDPNLIKQNITSILLYKIPERFRQEYFGTRIWEILEEPNTPAFAFILRRFILDGIRVWEPRVNLKDINVFQQGSTTVIRLTYGINNTNNIYELDFSYNPSLENSNL